MYRWGSMERSKGEAVQNIVHFRLGKTLDRKDLGYFQCSWGSSISSSIPFQTPCSYFVFLFKGLSETKGPQLHICCWFKQHHNVGIIPTSWIGKQTPARLSDIFKASKLIRANPWWEPSLLVPESMQVEQSGAAPRVRKSPFVFQLACWSGQLCEQNWTGFSKEVAIDCKRRNWRHRDHFGFLRVAVENHSALGRQR